MIIEEQKTGLANTQMQTIYLTDNKVYQLNYRDITNPGSALDGSHPMLTAVSPTANNLQSLTQSKPQLG